MKFKTQYIYYLMAFNLVLRLIMAVFADLGIDESYYFTYAIHPALSYFDHPPLVGYMAWLTTLGTHLMHPFFVRLGSLIIGTINVWLVFRIGSLIQSPKAGFYAAILYCSSAYTSVMASVFLMPDAPLSMCWLLGILSGVKYIQTDKSKYLLLFGTALGLAMLSKYHAAFLGVGMLIYILVHHRKTLLKPAFYIALFISLVVMLPVLIWNIQNEFISFSFHVNRAGGISLKPLMFIQDISGQFAYNGFVPFVIAMISLLIYFKNRREFASHEIRLLLLVSVPIWIFVIGISLFNHTQPHWSGPAYFGFFILSGIVLDTYLIEKRRVNRKMLLIGLMIFTVGTMGGVLHVNFGLVPTFKNEDVRKQGQYDFSLDMYGWDQVTAELDKIIEINPNVDIITRSWFAAAQIQYHFAVERVVKLFVFDGLREAHNFYYTNQKLGDIKQGRDAFYITTSNYYREIPALLIEQYERCEELETIVIKRGKHVAYYVFVYKLENVKDDFNVNALNN